MGLIRATIVPLEFAAESSKQSETAKKKPKRNISPPFSPEMPGTLPVVSYHGYRAVRIPVREVLSAFLCRMVRSGWQILILRDHFFALHHSSNRLSSTDGRVSEFLIPQSPNRRTPTRVRSRGGVTVFFLRVWYFTQLQGSRGRAWASMCHECSSTAPITAHCTFLLARFGRLPGAGVFKVGIKITMQNQSERRSRGRSWGRVEKST